MSRTPMLDHPPSDLHGRPTRSGRGTTVLLVVAGVVVAVVVALVAGYATGLFGPENPEPDVPATAPGDEPAPGDDAQDPAADVEYGQEPPANWDVIGVAEGDVLDVRDAPGTDHAVIAELAHDAAEFESTGRIAYVGEQLWREVVVPGDGVGWVNAAYLMPTAPPSGIVFGEEPPANWDVTGVAEDDVLNVRSSPGVLGDVVAELAHDAAEFESTGRIAHVGDQLWREVVVPGDGVGWVNAAYLVETRGGA